MVFQFGGSGKIVRYAISKRAPLSAGPPHWPLKFRTCFRGQWR
jgi:hypothetical protein